MALPPAPAGAFVDSRQAEAASSNHLRSAHEVRQSVDRAIKHGEWGIASAGLRELFRTAPGYTNAKFICDRFGSIPQAAPMTQCRLAFLRSFTVEPIVPLLRAKGLLYGIDVVTQVGDFNAYARELLEEDSALYEFSPNVVVLAVQTRDLLPELWDAFADFSPTEVERAAEGVIADLAGWIQVFRARCHAHLIIHNFEVPEEPVAGVLDAQSPDGQIHALHRQNQRLAELATEHTGVHILDYDGLVARVGRHRWHDERKWLTARMPIAADSLLPLVDEYLRFLLPISGRVAKALVVDLDNTLWSGVVSEDGPDGIRLDTEYPAVAHLRLQRAIVDLRARGIILAVASKNDGPEALEVIERNPRMLLRRGDFAAFRINWNDKPENLREIARELNIGLESVAFLDDSPAERHRVSLELPQVTVVDLPSDPMGYASALRNCPVFERLTISNEDLERGRHYSEQTRRHDQMRSAPSVEDYYRSLGTRVEISEASAQTVPRVAQLTQKTNQFNLTTRRYTESQIAMLIPDASVRVYQATVRDRFGDSGLVGVAITRNVGGAWDVDTLLLSCRVIGRTIETAFLSRLADEALADGAYFLRGWFRATTRNSIVSDFYPKHGFTLVGQESGDLFWELDLRTSRVEWPEWIEGRQR